LTEEQVASLRDPEHGHFTSRELIALQFTELLVTSTDAITDAFFDELKLHLSPPEILELAYFVMYSNVSHRISATLKSEPPATLRIQSAQQLYGIELAPDGTGKKKPAPGA